MLTIIRASKKGSVIRRSLHAVARKCGHPLRFCFTQADAEPAFWNGCRQAYTEEPCGDTQFYDWREGPAGGVIVNPETGESRELGCKWHLIHNFKQHAKGAHLSESETTLLTQLGTAFCDADTDSAYQKVRAEVDKLIEAQDGNPDVMVYLYRMIAFYEDRSTQYVRAHCNSARGPTT